MDKEFKEEFREFINNPLFIGVFFSFYIIFIRYSIYPKYAYLLAADVELIKSFIEWFGVVYGLFIALVLVNIWQQFDTVEREFDREADAIFVLYQSAKQLHDNEIPRRQKKGQQQEPKKGQKELIIEGIREYVEHVLGFFQREHQNIYIKDTGDKILEKIRDAIAELVHTKEPESLTTELVRGFGEAADLRGDRISHSRQHLPAPLWNISVAASILWLLPFYGLNFQNNGVAMILVGGVTVIVVAILVIINDLDDVFEGTWKININDWELLAEKIDLKPTLLFVCDLDGSPFSVGWASINHHLRSKRLCALHSLLRWGEEKKTFFEPLQKSVFLRKFYKEEFEQLYKSVEPTPLVFCKSNSKEEVIVHAGEINEIKALRELGSLIQERLRKFGS